MKSRHLLGWVGIAFLLAGTSCNGSPEGFCEDLVEEYCEAVTGCCTDGAKFDVNACRIQVSNACQQTTRVEEVHRGDLIFDSGAAAECFGEVPTCGTIDKEPEDTFERRRACGNVLTGFRPVGSACDESSECAQTGDYAVCYSGQSQDGFGGGFCAEIVLDEEGCGFSFETNELRVCPDGQFCDVSALKPKPTDPPTTQAFEFTAKCKSLLGSGAKCLTANLDFLPCAKGLFCDLSSGTSATCQKLGGAGSSCNSQSECQDGLDCEQDGDGGSCEKPDQKGAFCFKPPVCGDDDCEDGENEDNCPKDCGGTCGGEFDFCEIPSDCCNGLCDFEFNECFGGGSCSEFGDPCESDTQCCDFFCDEFNQCS